MRFDSLYLWHVGNPDNILMDNTDDHEKNHALLVTTPHQQGKGIKSSGLVQPILKA
jgi:hypothetical protein